MPDLTRKEFDEKIEKVGLVVGCVIKIDGKFLLVQENTGKAAGLWNLPAGYVDKGETLEQTAAREAKEETGLDVRVGGLIGVWHTETTEPVKHAFHSEIIGGTIIERTDEIRAVQWFTYDQAKELNDNKKTRSTWQFEAITRARD